MTPKETAISFRTEDLINPSESSPYKWNEKGIIYTPMEQRSARQSVTLKVTGSNPVRSVTATDGGI